MEAFETIFNPLNDSLSERVRAYYSVCQAFTHSQASLKHTQQFGELDYLGDEQHIKDASRIIYQSFEQANAKVSQADLQEAKERGLISQEQLVEIVQVRRSQEVAQSRNSQTDSQTTQLKQ